MNEDPSMQSLVESMQSKGLIMHLSDDASSKQPGCQRKRVLDGSH